MSAHPVLSVGVAVRVLSDSQPFQLGLDRLDVDTWLGGGEAQGRVEDLTPHLVEVTWEQGTSSASQPEMVLPQPDAGVCELTLWDPDNTILPPASDPFGGIRPGRPVWLYDRADGQILWTGWIEQMQRSSPTDGPALTSITCVDSITRLTNSGVMPPNARSPETPHDRAVWTLATFAPGLPAVIDPQATAAQVAGTQVGDDPWQTLTDCADVELGGLFTLRDGTVVLLGNSAGEFTEQWRAGWTHEERTDAGRPLAGSIRVTDLGGHFEVVAHETPAGGDAWAAPPLHGDFLSITQPQTGYFILGAALSDATYTAPHWTWTVEKSNYSWPGTPPRGQAVEVALLDFTSSPPGTVQWTQPECSTAHIADVSYDLAMLRNEAAVRRRDTDTDLVGFSTASDATSIGHYGRWSFRWDSSPHDSAAGELRAAGLLVSAYARPTPTYARLHVNLTAAANTPERDSLMELVKRVQITNTIAVHSGRPRPSHHALPASPLEPMEAATAGLAKVYGWTWTWTAAGGLAGSVSLGRPAADPTFNQWFLGIVGASELDTSTVLA